MHPDALCNNCQRATPERCILFAQGAGETPVSICAWYEPKPTKSPAKGASKSAASKSAGSTDLKSATSKKAAPESPEPKSATKTDPSPEQRTDPIHLGPSPTPDTTKAEEKI